MKCGWVRCDLQVACNSCSSTFLPSRRHCDLLLFRSQRVISFTKQGEQQDTSPGFHQHRSSSKLSESRCSRALHERLVVNYACNVLLCHSGGDGKWIVKLVEREGTFHEVEWLNPSPAIESPPRCSFVSLSCSTFVISLYYCKLLLELNPNLVGSLVHFTLLGTIDVRQ